jgi:hypothetical protein
MDLVIPLMQRGVLPHPLHFVRLSHVFWSILLNLSNPRNWICPPLYDLLLLYSLMVVYMMSMYVTTQKFQNKQNEFP